MIRRESDSVVSDTLTGFSLFSVLAGFKVLSLFVFFMALFSYPLCVDINKMNFLLALIFTVRGDKI